LSSVKQDVFDIILADYMLPSFDGFSALAIAREERPDVPFIFVTGSLGEEVAIESLKRGATDYVLKHRLSRLVAAVNRALDESDARKERARLEEQLRQAQKMETIGTLAGGVAHDFNNLLTAIIGNAQLALTQVPAKSSLGEKLVEIERTGQRAAELTRQLLVFSRRQRLELRALDLGSTIRDFMKMLRRIIGEDIDLLFEEPSELPSVMADTGQIEQVLMNLAVNARDAMPNGGELLVTVREVFVTETGCLEHPSARPGRYIEILVSDTGSGMDEETKNHIFEPFFTTKEVGKGTGLGLAVVYGIVKHHEGFIGVKSQQSGGTTFRICLPVAGEAIKSETKELSQPPNRGSETVLLAEDEEILRKLVFNVLTGLGYSVLVANDGEEAVRTYQSNSDLIDLLVLDIVMPRMSGREAYRVIRRTGAKPPVVFISGYSEENNFDDEFDKRTVAFLPKPFPIGELGRKVRSLLDQKPNESADHPDLVACSPRQPRIGGR
jgi:signal transduction histidine kinase